MEAIKRNPYLIVFFLFSILYLSFILRSFFVIGHTIYFTLMDDAMISMRYAHNLALGYGLVWNPGERVDGISNLLWTLYMAAFHFTGIPIEKIGLLIQITGGVFLGLNLFMVKRVSDLLFKNDKFISLTSMLLTAFYLPLSKWAVYGSEVSCLVFLTTATVYMAVLAAIKKQISLSLFILLGIGTLIRIDFLVIAIPIIIYLFLKNFDRKDLIKGMLLLSCFLLAQELFLFLYYGDFFPNTYYLKMTGFPILLRVTNGVYITLTFISNMNWVLFFIPFIALAGKNKYTPLIFMTIAAQMLYNIYIGGDYTNHIELGSNRFLSLIMPLFFILFAAGILIIKNFLVENALIKKRAVYIGGLFLIFCLINFNAVFTPHSIGLYFSRLKLGQVPGSIYNTQKAKMIDSITGKDAKIAVIWAGTTPYFSNRYFIDLLGKNDKVIAHEDYNPALRNDVIIPYLPKNFQKLILFNPGHTKWDYDYSVGKLLPDITEDISNKEYKSKYIFVTIKGYRFYFLKNSPNIKWNKVKQIKSSI